MRFPRGVGYDSSSGCGKSKSRGRPEDQTLSFGPDLLSEQIEPLMPKPGRRGRPREADFRKVINAV